MSRLEMRTETETHHLSLAHQNPLENLVASQSPVASDGAFASDERPAIPEIQAKQLPQPPVRLTASFDEPALIKPGDWEEGCLQQNKKRLFFILTALAGIGWYWLGYWI